MSRSTSPALAVVGPHGAGPIPHGMGLIHLIGSYAGQFVFSSPPTGDVPDPAFYARCLQKSLDELSAAAAAVGGVPSAASGRGLCRSSGTDSAQMPTARIPPRSGGRSGACQLRDHLADAGEIHAAVLECTCT